MVSITFLFWLMVGLFAVIGAMRGWAKELLVSFSVILALAVNHVLVRYIPPVIAIANNPEMAGSLFWIRFAVVVAIVFFGYQTVASVPRLAARATKERLQDMLFGIVMGGVNGYLIVGTIWFYLRDANYPIPNMYYDPPMEIAQKIANMMSYMPPHWLGDPGIYIAVILAFIFVLVVYI
jgi:lysylphosphatidylglycerol synthetase-like protein (DUF2156 family)